MGQKRALSQRGITSYKKSWVWAKMAQKWVILAHFFGGGFCNLINCIACFVPKKSKIFSKNYQFLAKGPTSGPFGQKRKIKIYFLFSKKSKNKFFDFFETWAVKAQIEILGLRRNLMVEWVVFLVFGQSRRSNGLVIFGQKWAKILLDLTEQLGFLGAFFYASG